MQTYRQFLFESEESDFIEEMCKYASRVSLTKESILKHPALITKIILYYATHINGGRLREGEQLLKNIKIYQRIIH